MTVNWSSVYCGKLNRKSVVSYQELFLTRELARPLGRLFERVAIQDARH